MVQELISNKRIAIVGAGPTGCACAKFLYDFGADVTIFDKGPFLRTILPTGGGRCNLAHNEYDFRELACNYPRGEKFLYSIFSKFATQETIEFFNSIGVKTYSQDDNRIFPVSNSAKDVQVKILEAIKNCQFVSENVLKIEKKDNQFKIKTNKAQWHFDYVVITIGGHSNFEMIKSLGIDVVLPTPALVGFITEQNFTSLAGVSLKNIKARIEKKTFIGDIIFTHKGISGPLIYKLSSIFARKDFPYKIHFDFVGDIDFQNTLNSNPHKEIKNVISPKSLSTYILDVLSIKKELPCHKIDAKIRNKILDKLQNFEIDVIKKVPEGETVTCGGVNLSEINSKTLESKKIQGLYFGGEVLDIDGYCGGFNLQNCWSCAYVIANAVSENFNQ